ncbi:protein YIPF6-like [Crassostrea angulata]|uniref:protein YIPF6-like n=1 Tax=Magallana angulata TaxID=2784310 RepID=UPI0022B12347|nr:protein YIPF6-like [Crassostrea angulata]
MADVESVDFLKNQEGLNDVPLEGEILSPNAGIEGEEQEFNTLDEPVRETIMRDLKAIGIKFWHVLYPKQSKALLKEWDLWGPLILCVFMAIMLQGSSPDSSNSNNKDKGDGGPQFAEVFVIFWVGAVVVTLNTKLLGGNISFFQSICVLGYCVCPLTVALIVCRIILIATQSTLLFIIRFVIVIAAFGWSTFASTAFLADSQPSHRKALAIYPIFLFYFVISWLIISHTHTS